MLVDIFILTKKAKVKQDPCHMAELHSFLNNVSNFFAKLVVFKYWKDVSSILCAVQNVPDVDVAQLYTIFSLSTSLWSLDNEKSNK